MSRPNPILDSNNAPLTLANFLARLTTNSLDCLPLGTVGESVTGEVFLKVGIVSGNTNSGGFNIPPYDNIVMTYFGSTNNVQTQVFKLGSTVVSTLTYTYINGGVADNDKVATIVQS